MGQEQAGTYTLLASQISSTDLRVRYSTDGLQWACVAGVEVVADEEVVAGGQASGGRTCREGTGPGRGRKSGRVRVLLGAVKRKATCSAAEAGHKPNQAEKRVESGSVTLPEAFQRVTRQVGNFGSEACVCHCLNMTAEAAFI